MSASSPSAIAGVAPATDAILVAQLFAIDPVLAGGVVVRSFAGPVRDRWLGDLRAMLHPSQAWRPVPVHVDDDRLLGGIDLAATLDCGRPVAMPGLLAEADGGVLLLSMAERMAGSSAAHIAAALDVGAVGCARDGIATRVTTAFGVVALDESTDEEAPMNSALRDRLAFEIDLRGLSHRDCSAWPSAADPAMFAETRRRMVQVVVGDDAVEALCAAALALGVWSLRASVLAVRALRLIAAWNGRMVASRDDAVIAARLVLAPRAVRLPPQPRAPDELDTDESADDTGDAGAGVDSQHASEEQARDDSAMPPDAAADAPGHSAAGEGDTADSAALEQAVVAAAAAAIPAGLLNRIAAADAAGRSAGAPGRVGALQHSRLRGRPAGVRRGRPRNGARLDLLATLRAAVPWQRMRGRDAEIVASAADAAPRPTSARTAFRIRAEDFHVGHFQQRSRTTTIFAVDASGSSALHRLAEAKGAVELLLAECYVRRDSVAVIGFRGRAAELLLPPTRSLLRAKRALAELPGGGGTPLVAGFDAAAALAAAVRRGGDTAVVVILSDGRANVARDGSPGRPRAEADARVAARSLGACGAATIFIDTSTQPQPLARELAALMGARYVFLPHAQAATLSAAVRSATPAITSRR